MVAHLVQAMRHDHHGAARIRHAAQRRVERLRLSRGQGRRGLVEDDDTGVAREGAHDLEVLPVADAEALDGGVPVDGGSDRARHRVRPGPRSRAIQPAERLHGLRAEHHVLERGQRRREREVLLHHAHGAPEGPGERRPKGAHRALVGWEQSRGDPEQRRLAGAVLADDGVDLPDLERQRDVVDGEHRAEALADPLDGERGQRYPAMRRAGATDSSSPS